MTIAEQITALFAPVARISGADLAVGHTIDLLGGADTVVALRPYTGPLAELEGARIATFARGRSMTIPAGSMLEVR